MTYTILVSLDGEIFTAASSVSEEHLEGELQHLTRKHEYKNVSRFEILKEAEEQSTDMEI